MKYYFKEGDRYGRLTIKSEDSFIRNGQRRILCICDCGVICDKVACDLAKGKSTSCGCKIKIAIGEKINGIECLGGYLKKGLKNGYYADFLCHCGKTFQNFCGAISGGYVKSCGCLVTYNALIPGESLYNSIYSKLTSSAKKRNIPISITKEEAIELFKSNCAYCGTYGGNTITNKKCLMGTIQFNGIDRVDSNIGYARGNCVPCCKWCNRAKNSQSKEEFLKHIEKIYLFSRG